MPLDYLPTFSLELQAMESFSAGEKRTLSEFLNNFSIAWLSAGIIVPAFSETGFEKKVIYLAAGVIASSISLWGALKFSHNLKI